MRRTLKMWAGAALGLTLLLSSCLPTPLQVQRNALVNVVAHPAGPELIQSSFRPDVYRTPGPTALAVRTDRNAFVSVVILPVATGAWGSVPPGAAVLEPVQVPGGVTTPIALPPTPDAVQVFAVASVEPLNLAAARGVTSLKGVSQVLETAAKALPAGGYNVASLKYRVAQFGTLIIQSNVPGANVSVDDRLVGQTPFVTVRDIPAGPVEVKVQRAGFERWTASVQVSPNVQTPVFANLRPALGRVVVSSTVPADVYLRGQHAGCGTSVSARVPAGSVSVTVVPVPVAGQAALNSSGALVRVRADQTASVTCRVNTGFVCSGE